MRVFYVLHVKENALSDCLEAIRFLCNPAEKHKAHITVRGPYRKRIDIRSINRRIAGDTVEIQSVGNFFDCGQNTVYFRCSAPELKSVWNKPDYPFNPHITVYDSDSADFARRLFDVISRYKYRLRFRAEGLEAIEARKGQASFPLALAFDSVFVRQIVGKKLNPEDVKHLSTDRRLVLIRRLCKHLSELSEREETLELFGAPNAQPPLQLHGIKEHETSPVSSRLPHSLP